ncbi:MAG: serine hydrolase [Cyclobacteriaceae bacterium]|nr:serine hydrolase [Cyclobacteriaceae bacterium]
MKQLRDLNKQCFHLTFIIGIIWLFSSCSPKPTVDKLKDDIINTLTNVKGEFAVAFKDLSTGETLFINEKEVFHAASTMKTPVMIEVYKQAAEGKFSLNDSIEVKNEFKSIVDSTLYSLDVKDDSQTELYNLLGTKKLLKDLVYDMIITSSNLATNIVIELVDAKKVTATMRDLGAPDILILRGVEDQKAFDAGLNNTTTAYDLMVIFEKLANGEAVNPEADQQMINILLDQEFNEIIPAKLPKNVKVAHKTGSITGVQHDSALIILPDGRKYLLVMLSKNLKDAKAGVAAMANASELIYSYVTSK